MAGRLAAGFAAVSKHAQPAIAAAGDGRNDDRGGGTSLGADRRGELLGTNHRRQSTCGKWCKQNPDTGYGRGAGGNQKGYKFHAVWGRGPMPTAWGLAPMNVSEKAIAHQLIPALPGGGYLLANSQYDANPLYDLAAEAGFQLVAQKIKDRGRGGLGHRRQSAGRLRSMELLATTFGHALSNQRNAIECCFGAWVSFGGGLGPLPAWVRRFGRVRNWVQAKILVSGVRWLFLHEPHKLALA